MRLAYLIIVTFALLVDETKEGIRFEESLSWNDVQAKARADNKYIFVDCYTTWCGPCKFMADSIFSKEDVGKYINDRFISVRIQLDTTQKDNNYVKSWYKYAKDIRDKYHVNSFPTYLFFGPNGQIIHRAMGATDDPNQFIKKAKDAMDSSTQYYSLLDKFHNRTIDSTALRRLTVMAIALEDSGVADSLGNEYILALKNIYSKENLTLIGQTTKHSFDKGFDLYLNHANLVDSIMGKYYAERKVMNIIMSEDKNVLFANRKSNEGLNIGGYVNGQPIYSNGVSSKKLNISEPDWKVMYSGINEKYGPYYAKRIVIWTKIYYYKQRNKWNEYIRSVIDYVANYNDDIKMAQLNEYAWNIFVHSMDKKELGIGLEWSGETIKRSGGDEYQDTYIDTYANLLYKLGKKGEAVNYEKKALGLAREEAKESYRETLDKMKNGIKTWN